MRSRYQSYANRITRTADDKRRNANCILTRRACKASSGPRRRRRPPATWTCGGRPRPTTTTKKKTSAGGRRASVSRPSAAPWSSRPTELRRQRSGTAVGCGYRRSRRPVAAAECRDRVGRAGAGDDDGGGGGGGGGDGSSCGDSDDGCDGRAGGADGGCAAGRRRCAGTDAGGVGNTTAKAAGRHTSSWPLRLVRAVQVMVLSSARRRGSRCRGCPAGQLPIRHGCRPSTIYGDVVVVVVVVAVRTREMCICGGRDWPTTASSFPGAPGSYGLGWARSP